MPELTAEAEVIATPLDGSPEATALDLIITLTLEQAAKIIKIMSFDKKFTKSYRNIVINYLAAII
jgi:hypothetical protein